MTSFSNRTGSRRLAWSESSLFQTAALPSSCCAASWTHFLIRTTGVMRRALTGLVLIQFNAQNAVFREGT